MNRKILIMDTTLRDGEKIPGAKLSINEKLKMAYQLQRLNVDIIDAGFPGLSENDYKAVQIISQKIGKDTIISATSKPVRHDIDEVYNCLRTTTNPILHIILGSYDVYAGKNKEQIFLQNIEAIKYGKSIFSQVQYTIDDASRLEFNHLWGIVEAAAKAGATIINLPDSVGFAVPEEYGDMINKINNRLKNLNSNIMLSVHCHNDTGLATANSLAAVKNGADKVECTINGIGERAGNAALEEIVMGIKLHKEYYNAYTNIITSEIKTSSKLVTYLTGIDTQVNKAITGDNAFTKSSVLLPDGLIKVREDYAIINPKDVGVEKVEPVLSATSGRNSLKSELAKIGFVKFTKKEFENIYKNFLTLANKKKEIYVYDLFYLIDKNIEDDNEQSDEFFEFKSKRYELIDIEVVSNILFSRASVKMKKKDNVFMGEGTGNGPIDAVYTAIRDVIKLNIELKEYKIKSISKGKEALGKVSILVSYNKKSYTAKAVDTDVIKASAYALINAFNSIIIDEDVINSI
ncbi:2-isopropylmalate synthase [Clostridium hydrogenum]|uniref:2-isopropylmalate synthase n=1 Tax=Clostridium hydrogenum TaxID=2855764 RepID=UPI001F1D3990|nr:2-isopropylmalate synthase [Clostridium hydrogenum]